MRAATVVALSLVFSSCQCLQAVDEHDGGGGGSATGGGGAATGGGGGAATGGGGAATGGGGAATGGGSATGGGGAATGGGSATGGGAATGGGGSATGGGGGFLDAGTCVTASDCSGSAGTPAWCGSTVAGFSCVESLCVWECPQTSPGRTCTVNMGTYCLECGDAGTICPNTGTTSCGSPQFTGNATVETGATCTSWPQSGDPFTEVALMRGASAQCRYQVANPDGGELLGEIWKLTGGDYLADFPGFGGWCTGRSAFTGAPRGIITCPDCSFTLMGFE